MSDDGCHVSDVNFETGRDACGNFALLGVLAQGGETWVLMSGSSNFRINTPDVLEPVAVTLQHDDTVMHTWNEPEGFVPVYLSRDLRMIYFKMPIITGAGDKLADLVLGVADNEHFRFVNLTREDAAKLIKISSRRVQSVKGLDGASLQLHLPRICR